MDLRVAGDLWATSMLPEGIFERWRVEDAALHEIVVPSRGLLVQRVIAGAVIGPGSLLAQLHNIDPPSPS